VHNDANFGGPLAGLLSAGVRDLVWPTFWMNPPFSFGPSVPGQPLSDGPPALAFQASLASGARVNLLAANGQNGPAVSGSGIWPADPAAPGVQHYEPVYGQGGRTDGGWIGIADLVSAGVAEEGGSAEGGGAETGGAEGGGTAAARLAADAAVVDAMAAERSAAAVAHDDLPAMGENGTVAAMWFDVPADGTRRQLTARVAVDGGSVACELRVEEMRGGPRPATYALVAGRGLLPLGVYVEACTVAACARDVPALQCLYAQARVLQGPDLPAAGGNAPGLATFAGARLAIETSRGNTAWPSALCANGTVPLPRPDVDWPRLRDGGARDARGRRRVTTRPMSPSCALSSATLEMRPRWQEQTPICPHGLRWCSRYDVRHVHYATPEAETDGLLQRLFTLAFFTGAVLLLGWHPLYHGYLWTVAQFGRMCRRWRATGNVFSTAIAHGMKVGYPAGLKQGGAAAAA
jgi:hypothetical protein